MKLTGFNGEKVAVTKERDNAMPHDNLIISIDGHRASLHILKSTKNGIDCLVIDVFTREGLVIAHDCTT